MEKLCTHCALCYRQDSGYSNYTVEETEISCLLDLNPHFPATESYLWETEQSKEVRIAQKCKSYRNGEPIHIDVERESGNDIRFYTKDEVALLTWRLKYGNYQLY